ncbi:MAG: hypothetical protein PHZ03_01940 [Syntrophomonas sp.]|nr:hypothetical protein [Syntrophomonas sp.]
MNGTLEHDEKEIKREFLKELKQRDKPIGLSLIIYYTPASL